MAQSLALVAFAAAPIGASVMVEMGAPRALGHIFALLMWAATSLMCLLSIPERSETDAAKLRAAKAELLRQVEAGPRLAAGLSDFPILHRAAVTLAADAAALLDTLNLLQ